MSPKLHSPRHCVIVTLLVLTTVMAMTSARYSFQENACHVNEDVSSICYQCAKMHESEYNEVFDDCCGMDGAMREYCRGIYTEPPKKGGLWLSGRQK